MSNQPRLNRVIDLLQQGKHVFGSFASTGSIEDASYFGDSDYDFVIFEMEHSNFDFPSLRLSLQFLINRRRVLEQGTLAPPVTPLVRIPANGREQNQWLTKQALDQGVFGLVLPHINTVDEAMAAVAAARYPQLPGSADAQPLGLRGTAPGNALRYWGIPYPDYYRLADLWPLDPDGELLLMPLIEEEEGLKNVRDIMRHVKGIGVAFVGEVDLAVSMGYPGNPQAPAVQAALREVVAAGREFNVPVACLATPQNIQERMDIGFRVLVAGPQRRAEALEVARNSAA